MISKTRRDSMGGVVAEFFRVLQKPTRFSGGVVAEFFVRVLRDQTAFGGGGDSNRNFPLSSVARSHFYPASSDIRG